MRQTGTANDGNLLSGIVRQISLVMQRKKMYAFLRALTLSIIFAVATGRHEQQMDFATTNDHLFFDHRKKLLTIIDDDPLLDACASKTFIPSLSTAMKYIA